MFDFKSYISINREAVLPVFLQIANSIIGGIKNGNLRAGEKLPGTRILASLLKIHRKTAIAALEELKAQGWVETIPPKGTFVNKAIPSIQSNLNLSVLEQKSYPIQTGYKIKQNKNLFMLSDAINHNFLEFDDGLPDVRLAPIVPLTRTHRNVIKRTFNKQYLSYSGVKGNSNLRKALSEYLNSSREMNTQTENIFITRGSQMAIYLVANVIVSPGDHIIVGDISYFLADSIFKNAGAKLLRVKVDDGGICVDKIEEICKKKSIRAVFVTPHHHQPTTVTLNTERRVKLLSLSEKYGFCIIEDDYDYDFHYLSNPNLPLASADKKGMVIYIGSFSKSIAPAMRIGYISAPLNLIEEIAKLRRVIDLQGDPILEQVFAELIIDGEIKRHMKKALMEYNKRRDYFCSLLKDNFNGIINFNIPNGGMAVWAKFDKTINLVTLSEKALRKNLIISNGLNYNTENKFLNSTRMGFASLNFKEIEKSVELLKKIISY